MRFEPRAVRRAPRAMRREPCVVSRAPLLPRLHPRIIPTRPLHLPATAHRAHAKKPRTPKRPGPTEQPPPETAALRGDLCDGSQRGQTGTQIRFEFAADLRMLKRE